MNNTHNALLVWNNMTAEQRLLHTGEFDNTWRSINEWSELVDKSVSTVRRALSNLASPFGHGPFDVRRRGSSQTYEYRAAH